jgi:hypothetical protein
VAMSERRFLYERFGFSPARCDMIGFGPAAISTVADGDFDEVVKWMNVGGSDGYVA